FDFVQSQSNEATFTGNWNLSYADGGSTIGTDGAGTATHDPVAETTTIETFAGSLTDGGKSYGCTMTDLVTSYASNSNFVPQSGTVKLTGGNIDSVTVQFQATSPATGDVLVSIDGGAFFSYNLFEN